MMKLFLLGLKIVLVLALQSTLVHLVDINGIMPDLVLIFLVHIAIKHGAVVGVFSGFIFGLTEDIYGPIEYMGAAALSKSFIGYFVGQLDETFLKLDFVTKVALMGISFFVCDLIYAIAIRMEQAKISEMFMMKSLPEGIYTLLVGSLVLYLMNPTRDRNAAKV